MTPWQALVVVVLLMAPIVIYAWVHDGPRAARQLVAIVAAAAAWAVAVLWLVISAGGSGF